MTSYNKADMLRDIQKIVEGYTVSEIIDNVYHTSCSSHCIGQGCSRTVFVLEQYPDVVFKLDLGEDWDSSLNYDDNFFESLIWKAAKYENIDSFFAETENIGYVVLKDDSSEEYYLEEQFASVDEMPNIKVSVNIQPRMYKIWEYSHACTDAEDKHSYRREKKICEKCGWRSSIMAFIVRKYGANEAVRLINFIEEHHISDLHSNNWGITEDGDVKIIDYAMVSRNFPACL